MRLAQGEDLGLGLAFGVLDIDVEELKASYSKELAGGQIKANAKVAESLYRKAIGEGRESVSDLILRSAPLRASRRMAASPRFASILRDACFASSSG